MSKTREAKTSTKPGCKRCLHPGFRRVADTDLGRPCFQCDKCGDTWTSGRSGAPYLGHEMSVERVKKEK